MSMTFYYKPMSSATRVHWALEELGVPYEKVRMNLDGDQRKPEYLKLNPNGKVPLLVVDGHAIFESLAQLLWLGETYGVDKGLFPKPGLDRAEAFKWMAWVSVSVHDAVVRVIMNGERVPEDERNPKARSNALQDIERYLGILDEHMKDSPYILGDRFSLADCAVASIVPFAGRLGANLASLKKVGEWSGRCMAREALARVTQG